jgi:hypothetical protein
MKSGTKKAKLSHPAHATPELPHPALDKILELLGDDFLSFSSVSRKIREYAIACSVHLTSNPMGSNTPFKTETMVRIRVYAIFSQDCPCNCKKELDPSRKLYTTDALMRICLELPRCGNIGCAPKISRIKDHLLKGCVLGYADQCTNFLRYIWGYEPCPLVSCKKARRDLVFRTMDFLKGRDVLTRSSLKK